MNTVSNKPDRKGEENADPKAIRKKAPLTERIMKKAAAAAVTFGIAVSPMACSLMTDFEIPAEYDANRDADSDNDAGPDAHVADSDIRDSDVRDSDADEVVDSDIQDSDVSDGDVADADTLDSDVADADVVDSDVADSDIVDSDVLDGDISDGDVADADEDIEVTDADVSDSDVEEDAGPTICPGVSDGSISSERVDLGDSIVVGGYSLTYAGQVAGSDDIYIDISCAATGADIETGVVVPLYGTETAHAPLDGKDIEITNHSSSDTRTRISATVSDS